MNNFYISFNVVFPIFVMMSLGYFVKCINLVDSATVKKMNSAIFKLFLPVMLFKNIYSSNIHDVFNTKLILFSVISVLVLVAALYLIVPFVEKENSKRGVIIQAIFRSNFVIFGVPVTEALCGSGVTGAASVLAAVVVPLFNLLAVITLEIFNGKKPDFKKIIKGIVTNPLIVASAIGIIVLFSGIRFPLVIENAFSDISKITTPLALIMLGASIDFKKIGSNALRLILSVGAKLVIVPAIFLSFAVFVFEFHGPELAILLAVFATPPAVSSFTMAQQMNADSDLAGLLVMFGTVLSVISMFLWIYTIKYFQLM